MNCNAIFSGGYTAIYDMKGKFIFKNKLVSGLVLHEDSR